VAQSSLLFVGENGIGRMTPLAGIRVIEACQRLIGPLAGWHLAKMGADVVKVESPNGDIARTWPSGAVFDLLNAGKRCVALDFSNDNERMAFASICAGADIVLADSSWSEAVALEGSRRADARTRSIVVVDEGSVPGGYRSSETLAQAAMALTSYIGLQGQRPTRLGADVGSESAAAAATQVALAGLVRNDEGPLVGRVSVDRALSTLKTIHWAARSDPDRWAGYHVTAITRQPDRGYRVRDGWITLDFPPTEGAGWRSFCEEIGLGEFVKQVGDDWFSTMGMEDAIDKARPNYERALAKYTVEEAIAIIRKHQGWSVPFQNVSQMLQHPQSQLYASAVLVGEHINTRLPWRVNNQPQGTSSVSTAPAIGTHNFEVLGTCIGVS
jgi:crotonobetainyl-CoA:carnitine CoA-transferase CaiB-like acyl-CoA transferase